MYEELRDRAITNLERRRKKEKAVQVVGVVLGSIATLLFGIMYFMVPADRPYMLIPVGILGLLFSIIYTSILGLPFINNEISENDIEMEVAKIYREYKSTDLMDLTEEEQLEIRQIEILMDDKDEYV